MVAYVECIYGSTILCWNDNFGLPCIPCILLNNVEKSLDARSVYNISICLKSFFFLNTTTLLLVDSVLFDF